ncbi:MAG: CZB domain-containing protein [Gammaproteobacteria bacterium]|nr:CZB domain-containing protein [Gammaproteobacteria bacterium]MCW8992137.1 CZB domain-containing protein [Gammaproteobacteria bacterium]
MDIKQEINQHLEWIEKIASLLGSEEVTQAKIDALTQHDKCELGRWLSAEDSRAYRGYPEFQALIDSHAEFHRLAGKLLAALEQENEAEALETGAKFIEMSQQVIGHLQALDTG